MASLRAAFIETFRPVDNVFYALVAYFPIIFHPAGAAEEIGKEKKVPVFSNKVSTKGKPLYVPQLGQPNLSLKALQGLVSMNINNFSQLLDGNSNDFKDCENLVHTLELNQEEETFALSQIDTIHSLNISFSLFSTSKTNKGSTEEDFSEVEEIEN